MKFLTVFRQFALVALLLPLAAIATPIAPSCPKVFLSASENQALGFDFKDGKQLVATKKIPLNVLKSMQEWIRQNQSSDGYLKIKPLSPEAPELVFYNWGKTQQNIEDVTRGISPAALKQLLTKKDPLHLGIYLSADPTDTSNYGDILIQIAVYKDQYPLQNGSQIDWQPIQSYQFHLDQQGNSGSSANRFFKDQSNTPNRVIEDLRVIKQMRFPPKSLTQQFWFQADFNQALNAGQFNLSQEIRVAQQWLLTPNYSAKERANMFHANPKLFLQYLNLEQNQDMSVIPVRRATKEPSMDVNALKLNGILQAITGVQESFVDFESGLLNYNLLIKNVETLSNENFAFVQWIRNGLPESFRLRQILDLCAAAREKDPASFAAAKNNLIQRAHALAEASKIYLAYNKKIIQDELNALALLP